MRSLYDCYVGLADTTPQFDYIAPYWLIIALYTSNLFSMDRGDFFPISQFTSFTFMSICFLFFVICSFQFSLHSKCALGILLILFGYDGLVGTDWRAVVFPEGKFYV